MHRVGSKIVTKTKRKIPYTLPAALSTVFQFTDADLRANRKGTISAAQKQTMQEKHEDNIELAQIGIIFITVIGFFGSGLAAIEDGLPLFEMWAWMTFTLLLVNGVVWLIFRYNHTRLTRTIQKEVIEQVRGPMFVTTEGGKDRTYYFCIGSQRFDITFTDHSLLKRFIMPGQQATVYYTSGWRHVLSVELHPAPLETPT